MSMDQAWSPPVFFKKVFLLSSHTLHLWIVYGCFYATVTELSSGRVA